MRRLIGIPTFADGMLWSKKQINELVPWRFITHLITVEEKQMCIVLLHEEISMLT